MKILLVNKYNFVQGGSDRYFMELAEKLRSEGHEVAKFCMQHEKNLPERYEAYFAEAVDYNKPQSLFKQAVAALRVIYNFEAKKKFARLLDDFKPDLIHAHNIYHQLSPSILSAAHRRRIPIILHLHDYKLISPNYSLYSHGRINESFVAPHYFRCVGDRCVKNSYLKSFLAATEMFIHHRVLKIYEKTVSTYIAPSTFMKDMCSRHGINARFVKKLCYFIEPVAAASYKTAEPPYIVYVGRLSEEKGISVLLEAVAKWRFTGKLKIAGIGPEEPKLRSLVVQLGIAEKVDFLGQLEKNELFQLIDGALANVIPSVWYENMPFSMLETMGRGKTVIASRIGGMPEMIKHRENGLLFKAGDSDELASLSSGLTTEMSETLGRSARATVADLDWSHHWSDLKKIYEEVL